MNCAGIFGVPSEDLPAHRLLLLTEGPLSAATHWSLQKGNTKTHAKGLHFDASIAGWMDEEVDALP